MRRRNVIKRLLILFAFVVMPFTTYLTVSHVKTCEAQTCPCGGSTCIEANQFAAALRGFYNNVIGQPHALTDAKNEMAVAFKPLTEYFADGILPVVDWMVRQLKSWFDTFWFYNLQPTMQRMAEQLTSSALEQVFSIASFHDVANVIRIRRTMNDMQLEDHRSLRPSGNVCTAGTMMGGMQRADAFSRGFNAAASGSMLSRTANTWGQPAGEGAASDMLYRWKTFARRFCKTDYNNTHANCEGNVDSPFPNADIDVADMVFSRDTIPLDPAADPNGDTRQNLDAMIMNLAEPFVKDPVTASVTGAKDALLRASSYKSKRQLVYDSLYYVISRRVPAGMPQSYVDRLREIRGTTHEDASTSPNPSRNEILRALMTQKYRNGQYALSQIDEPENNRREMVIQEALQLIQMSDQLDLLDHYSLLLAAQVSTQVQKDMGFETATAGGGLVH